MNSATGTSEVKNPKTGMSQAEMKEFIRNHFEEFVNRKNLRIGEVNFASGFVDHGADVPPGLPPGPAGAIEYLGPAVQKSTRPQGDHRRHDRRRRQGGGAQSLDRNRRGNKAAGGILWNCDLEDCQPADFGALGSPGEASRRTGLARISHSKIEKGCCFMA